MGRHCPSVVGGCSIFRPAVEVHALTAREAIELKRSDILDTRQAQRCDYPDHQGGGIGCKGMRKADLIGVR